MKTLKQTLKERTYPIVRSGSIDKIDENERKIRISFSSETPTGGFYKEILSHSKGSVDLSIINAGASVLYNHDPDKVIGRIINAKIENRRGVADIVFDDDEFSDSIYKKVTISKSIQGVSVGAMPNHDDILYLEKGQNKKLGENKIAGPATIYRKWQPREISITPIPADTSVGVNRMEKSTMDIKEIIENPEFTKAIEEISTKVSNEILKSIQTKDDEKNDDGSKALNERLLKRAAVVSEACKGVVAEMILSEKNEDEISNYILKSAMQHKDESTNKKSKEDIDDNFILRGLKF